MTYITTFQLSVKLKTSQSFKRVFKKTVTCNDLSEELNGLRQLLGALALPLNGEQRHGLILQVHANRGELNDFPLNLQPPNPCAH